ncbi:MAG TPA: hypothetical protein VGD60_06910 [Candidatus Acidoferrales bacterium]
MNKIWRVPVIHLVVLGALLLVADSRAQERPPILEKIAKAYGVDSWGQIEVIRYTFNASFGPVTISHSWQWEPKTGKVTYGGKDHDGKPVKVTYLRSQLSTQPDSVKNETDPAFMNDNYWLIFPFHATWDASADVKDEGKQKLPLGKGTADKVVVKYPADVGYTPGDTWTLFVGPDCRVQEFTYHRGGPKKPTDVITTWAAYKKAGPLLVATDHRGTADGKPVRIFFTDVAVKLTGSDIWLNAQ